MSIGKYGVSDPHSCTTDNFSVGDDYVIYFTISEITSSGCMWFSAVNRSENAVVFHPESSTTAIQSLRVTDNKNCEIIFDGEIYDSYVFGYQRILEEDLGFGVVGPREKSDECLVDFMTNNGSRKKTRVKYDSTISLSFKNNREEFQVEQYSSDEWRVSNVDEYSDIILKRLHTPNNQYWIENIHNIENSNAYILQRR